MVKWHRDTGDGTQVAFNWFNACEIIERRKIAANEFSRPVITRNISKRNKPLLRMQMNRRFLEFYDPVALGTVSSSRHAFVFFFLTFFLSFFCSCTISRTRSKRSAIVALFTRTVEHRVGILAAQSYSTSNEKLRACLHSCKYARSFVMTKEKSSKRVARTWDDALIHRFKRLFRK